MRFIFDCEDEIALPAAYGVIDKFGAYINKIKEIDVEGATMTRREAFKAVLANAMVKYPKETSEILARLWILEEGEQAPNAFVTITTLVGSEVAINFFTSVVPSIVQISSVISPKLK